jgi:phosphoserine phosphatase
MSDTPRQIDTSKMLRLLEVVRRLGAPSDLQELLGDVIDAGREVLDADRGTVFLYDPEPRELFIKVATGLKELRFSIDGQGIAHECARTREIINVPDCYADERFNPGFDKQTGYRTNCLIAVPLVGLDDELVGVMQLLNAAKGKFDSDDEQIAAALASQAAVAIQRALLIDERMVKMKMENDLEIAREIQQGVLPRELPEIDGYEVAVFNRPADETGGDIYDIARDPDLADDTTAPVLLMLADATGHGIGPALSVTQARAMFRIGLRLKADLKNLIDEIDEQLDVDLASSRFITAFFGELDPRKHTIEYHAPGQGPILKYQASDGQCESRPATSVPLGVMPGMPGDEHEPFVMEVGDIFLLLTDGFFEQVDEDAHEFSQDQVARVVHEASADSAQQVIEALVAALDAFRGSGPQLDDWTAVVIKRAC